jgi:phosphoesterase RecJ-like protein
MKAINVGVAHPFRPAEEQPRVVEVLRTARRLLVTMHRQPDGDALGSTLGLAAALREAGKEAVVYNPDPPPRAYRFLPGADRIVATLSPAERFDATIVADAGRADRLGPDLPGPDRRGIFVNLDHHAATEPFGDLNYVDPAAASVGVLVFKLLRALGLPVSRPVATCLYASIVADTGGFRYASTDPEALRIAAELLEAGVDPWEMTVQLYERQPIERMRLLAEVLSTLEVGGGGALAMLTITAAMQARTGTSENLTDGFINHARAIEGIEVAASLTELADGRPEGWQVSFRSRGRIDVSRIASRLGGGGHRNAAGCLLAGGLAEARARLAAEVEAEVQAAGQPAARAAAGSDVERPKDGR